MTLSRVERQILARYAEGWTRQRIAKEQSMSVRQVGHLLARIRWRIGASNTTHAVYLAARAGVI